MTFYEAIGTDELIEAVAQVGAVVFRLLNNTYLADQLTLRWIDFRESTQVASLVNQRAGDWTKSQRTSYASRLDMELARIGRSVSSTMSGRITVEGLSHDALLLPLRDALSTLGLTIISEDYKLQAHAHIDVDMNTATLRSNALPFLEALCNIQQAIYDYENVPIIARLQPIYQIHAGSQWFSVDIGFAPTLEMLNRILTRGKRQREARKEDLENDALQLTNDATELSNEAHEIDNDIKSIERNSLQATYEIENDPLIVETEKNARIVENNLRIQERYLDLMERKQALLARQLDLEERVAQIYGKPVMDEIMARYPTISAKAAAALASTTLANLVQMRLLNGEVQTNFPPPTLPEER